MTAINREKFAKVWALVTSPMPGEAAAARTMAERMPAAAGMSIADVPDLLEAPPAGAGAWYQRRHSENARRDASLRAEVIRRYGSEAAAMAWTAEEEALRETVRRWSSFSLHDGGRWTSSIDGAGYWTRLEDVPARVICALSAALPLPGTVSAAKLELDRWERRRRDLQLIYYDDSETQLDLPAAIRRDIVRELFEVRIRAGTLEDVLLRQRHLVAQECAMPEMEEAILADLEFLNAKGVQSGHQDLRRDRASDRRAAVLTMLGDAALSALSDREIGRRAGVSPTTVGSLRRRLAQGSFDL